MFVGNYWYVCSEYNPLPGMFAIVDMFVYKYILGQLAYIDSCAIYIIHSEFGKTFVYIQNEWHVAYTYESYHDFFYVLGRKSLVLV